MTNDGVTMTLPTAFEMMSERIQLISCLALTFKLLQHGGVVRIYMPLHVTLAEATQAIQKPDVVCWVKEGRDALLKSPKHDIVNVKYGHTDRAEKQ